MDYAVLDAASWASADEVYGTNIALQGARLAGRA